MAVSYRMDFCFKIASILLMVAMLYFPAKLIGSNPAVQEYGGYLPFVAIGMALMNYFMTGYQSFAAAIRSEQVMGTLESVLMAPVRIPVLVIASSAWDFCWALLNAAIFLVAAGLIYHIEFKGNPIGAAVFLILTTLVYACLGVISASFIMVFKRGNPMNFFVGTISTLLGGTVFPVSIFPHWLQKISYALPLTWGLDGLRGILLKGLPMSVLLPQLGVLALFASVALPLSLFCFKKAIYIAQRQGSLLQY
ncbi:MAG: ABC transporter permease [Candidatus Sumerlaeota bacterium]|nr:ABC transporter permease [Candidatus Sumerlaeota bacterium]